MPGPVLTWFAAAIVLGALAAAPLSADARITVSGALAAFVIMLFRYEPRLIRAAALAALVASVAYTTIRTQLEPQVNQTRTMRFAGTVLEARTTPDGLHEYQVGLDGSIRVLVLTHGSAPLGARIVIRGRLEAFDGPRNPGEPSEQEIERENGLQGRIASATILEVRAPRAHAFASTIAAGKAWAADQLRLRLGDPGAAIVAGELWGARDALPPDLRTAFQETGTVHILVTAGLHVGLVATLAVAACMLLGVSRSVSCGIAIALIWAFAMLSGAHIPAVRAASMASMALLARACGRATYSWNALAAGAIAFVIYDPLDVSGASFWLSFCCVGAIFALVAPLERALDRYALPHRLREALVLTIATQLGTWPITAAVFLQFAPYAIAGNAAIVPCVPITMVLGALQIALAWCAPFAQAAANLNGWIIAWMIGVVECSAAFRNRPGHDAGTGMGDRLL